MHFGLRSIIDGNCSKRLCFNDSQGKKGTRVDTKTLTLSDILSGQRQHIIPVFQRPYSWTQKNWDTLWSDILLLIDEGESNYQHFLGPMIIDRGDTGSYVPEKYLVIDGQQRLVTLSILLCALRDVAIKHNLNAFADSVEPFFSFQTTAGEPESRLLPRATDKTAYDTVIQLSKTKLDNKQRIVKAYKFFLKQVRAGLPECDKEIFPYLNILFTATVARLKFVTVTLQQQDDPTKIYESMNFKGKRLLVADLIRNFVMMHLPDADSQDRFFVDGWEPFEMLFADIDSDQPDSKELEDFYYRYLISKKDYFFKRLVYSSYKNHLMGFLDGAKTKSDKLDSLRRLVNDQARFATFYRRIMHPELEPDSDLRAAFLRFGYLEAKTAIPFVLSLYDRYDDSQQSERITKNLFLKMMNAMESFIIRRSIMNLRTRGYDSAFAQAVRKSYTLNELRSHFHELGWPDDDKLSKELYTFPLYSDEISKRRLILTQLEKSFGHKEQVDISNPAKIQIEHIMPQSLTEEWEDMLGDDAASLHEMYVHTIGNLTLTGYNRELGAKSFQDKKSEYAKHGSHLELNRYILEQEQWTEAEITQRARLLIDRFIEIWPRPVTPKQAGS